MKQYGLIKLLSDFSGRRQEIEFEINLDPKFNKYPTFIGEDAAYVMLGVIKRCDMNEDNDSKYCKAAIETFKLTDVLKSSR